MTPEGRNTQYLLRRVKELGGIARKVTWQGRVGAPDWLVMINGRCLWIELKAPGKAPRLSQQIEFDLMQKHGGITVFVCDTPESIDEKLGFALQGQ